jgi:hypothetical protein
MMAKRSGLSAARRRGVEIAGAPFAHRIPAVGCVEMHYWKQAFPFEDHFQLLLFAKLSGLSRPVFFCFCLLQIRLLLASFLQLPGHRQAVVIGTKYVAKEPLWEEQKSAGKIRLPQMGMAEPD